MRCSPLFWRVFRWALGVQVLLWALFIRDEAQTRGTDLFEQIMVLLYGGPVASWLCSFYPVRSEADAGLGIVLVIPVAVTFVVFYTVVLAVAVSRFRRA